MTNDHPLRTPSDTATRSRGSRLAMGVLLTFVGLAVAAIILSPGILSSRDLLVWAATPTGLGLDDRWPVLVILSLDAAAIACVLMSILCTWLGERPGLFGILIWVFAGTSAFANWRHALTPDAPGDAIWFFPLMSLLGPGILDVVLSRVRGWLREKHTSPGSGTRVPAGLSWQRWIPGLGSFSETFGAYRTLLLIPGLRSFAEAVAEYQRLCPDGSVRVANALRRRNLARVQAETLSALQQPTAASAGDWPVDLMRRIPVHPDAYRRWRSAWSSLQTDAGRAQDNGSEEHPRHATRVIADQHGMSLRQLQFVRRAGEIGLLDSPIPPAVRLAQLSTGLTGDAA